MTLKGKLANANNCGSVDVGGVAWNGSAVESISVKSIVMVVIWKQNRPVSMPIGIGRGIRGYKESEKQGNTER